MKYLLHIDTSTDTGTIGLSGNGLPIATRSNRESRNHASSINIMIDEVLTEAHLKPADIDGVVVCAGPGSYTGLRIGMATAKGLCYALDKPLLLDNRLTLLAKQAYISNAKMPATYAAILVAREKEYFVTIYDKDFNCTLQPVHITEEELQKQLWGADHIYAITNTNEYIINNILSKDAVVNSSINIDMDQWFLHGFEQYNSNSIVNLSTAEPFYLKQVYTHK